MIFSGLGNKVGSADVDSDLEVSCRMACSCPIAGGLLSSQSPHEGGKRKPEGRLALARLLCEGVRMGWVPFFIREAWFSGAYAQVVS